MPEGAFGAFMATTASVSSASLCSGYLTLTMLVSSGATHNCVDPLLTPRLQDMMSDYCVLDVPHTIVAAGQQCLQVPGMGGTMLSVTEAMWKGVSTVFHPHMPRMEFDDIVLP